MAQKAVNPAIRYVLTADTVDLSCYKIEIHIRNAPRKFQIAMAAHEEYDDRFWRFTEKLTVSTENGSGMITRADSALWNISVTGKKAIIKYTVKLPERSPGRRGAWQPFLSGTGGLTGELHFFMYLPGRTMEPCSVQLNIPAGWEIATSLDRIGTEFSAPSFAALADAPILIGKFHRWKYSVDNITHTVCYFSEKSIAFDSVLLVTQIKKISMACRDLFGGLPYKKYFFLLQDESYGGLEHANSLPIGAPSAQLAEDPKEILAEIAHEYFHAWNLVRIKPAEWKSISYKTPELSKVLWWSEGLTLFYADLLLRRAKLPNYDSTRLLHLSSVLNNYYTNIGNVNNSAEAVSLTANGPNGMLGDYTASTHTQGEILGTMLDIIIRDKTNGRKSIDDVMRKLMKDFGGKRGIRSGDIANAIRAVSSYDPTAFFNDHIYGNRPPDLNRYLGLIGQHLTVTWNDAMDEKGNLQPDNRLYVWQDHGSTAFRIQMFDPESCWVKAGIHTGDTVIAVNEKSLTGNRELFGIFRSLKTGDKVAMKLNRNGEIKEVNITVSGYKVPAITIKKLAGSDSKKERLYSQWAASK
ncbi:MAG: PDZ domain-containing protein [Ferruginibacter sp.]